MAEVFFSFRNKWKLLPKEITVEKMERNINIFILKNWIIHLEYNAGPKK